MIVYEDDYKAHVVVLPSYTPVIICSTRQIAVDAARALYGDFESKGVRVQLATKADLDFIK